MKTIKATNDTTQKNIEDAVANALTDSDLSNDVDATVEDFVLTKATTDAEGSITGSVKLECGNASESVSISLVIELLSEDEPTDE